LPRRFAPRNDDNHEKEPEMTRSLAAAFLALMTLVASPALAHTGAGATSSFFAGLSHPLGGFDHVLAMVAVGLWAALRGGKAVWVWPSAFVGVMVVGGVLGYAGIGLPLVEPGILASIVILGLMVATAARVPVAAGAGLIGLFALFHGHAHGAEAPAAASALGYAAGFALATAGLHAAGIGAVIAGRGRLWQGAVRAAGAACAVAGAALAFGA
jgi:urease accessory protein